MGYLPFVTSTELLKITPNASKEVKPWAQVQVCDTPTPEKSSQVS